MGRNGRRVAAPALAGAIGLAACLSACGSDPPAKGPDGRTAADVLSDSGAALKRARSYHVKSDTQTGLRTTQYDLDVVGGSAEGRYGYEHDVNRTLNIMMVDNVLYAQGPAYWAFKLPPAAAAYIGDRCVKISPIDDATKTLIRQMQHFIDTGGYARAIASTSGDVRMESVTTSDGIKAINVIDNNSTVTVDAGKESYPLHIRQEMGIGMGFTDFSKFNEHGPITAPSGCIDLGSVNGGAPSSPFPVSTPSPVPLPSAGPSPSPPGLVASGPGNVNAVVAPDSATGPATQPP